MSDQDGHFYGSEAPLSGVGADLRAARERLGWTLPSVAATLRIRLPYLEAIEDGRISELPGNAYAVGFLRAYAQALGLDPDEISRRFKAEAADVNRKTELSFPAPVPERGIPAGAIVLVGAIIVIAAYIGWYRFSAGERQAADVVQPLPDRLAPLVGTGSTPTPPSNPEGLAHPAQPASDVPAAPPPQPAAVETAGPPIPPAIASAMPGPKHEVMGPPIPPAIANALAATQQLASVNRLGGPPASPNVALQPGSPLPMGGASPTSAVAAEMPHMVVRVKAETWVQVREKQGPVLFNRVMRSGETWSVPQGKGPLLLTTGNAAATELVADSGQSTALGADGAVRRDIPLDGDTMKNLSGPLPQTARPATVAGTRTN